MSCQPACACTRLGIIWSGCVNRGVNRTLAPEIIITFRLSFGGALARERAKKVVESGSPRPLGGEGLGERGWGRGGEDLLVNQ